MGGLLFILPIVAFDVWLCRTTGRRQVIRWIAQKNWRALTLAATAGLLLAAWLAFFVKYSNGPRLRVEGFPVPLAFFHLDENTWRRTMPPAPLPACGAAANFLTGLAAPFIPYKIAEFLKLVKAELK